MPRRLVVVAWVFVSAVSAGLWQAAGGTGFRSFMAFVLLFSSEQAPSQKLSEEKNRTSAVAIPD